MTTALWIAAALTAAIGLFHSVLGERYILVRLFRRENLPRLMGSDWFTKRTLRFAWHLTTVAWWGLATILVVLARPDSGVRSSVLMVIAATFAVSGVVTAAASRGRHFAWPVFLAIAVLCWLAIA